MEPSLFYHNFVFCYLVVVFFPPAQIANLLLSLFLFVNIALSLWFGFTFLQIIITTQFRERPEQPDRTNIIKSVLIVLDYF